MAKKAGTPFEEVIKTVQGPDDESPETPPGTRIIAFVNFKGGVGKTSCAGNVAGCLAHNYQKNVLLVDLDVQSSLGQWLMGPETWHKWTRLRKKTSYQIFLDHIQGSHAWSVHASTYKHPDCPRLHICPATYDMFDLDMRLQNALNRPVHAKPFQVLDIEIKKVSSQFDYIILDCPPNVYMTTQNALFCADYVIIPTIADFLSTAGIHRLIKYLDDLRGEFLLYDHKPVQVAGVLVSMFDRRQIAMSEAVKDLAGFIEQRKRQTKVFLNGAGTFETKIRDLTAINMAQEKRQPITMAAPNTELAKDFFALTAEIREVLGDD